MTLTSPSDAKGDDGPSPGVPSRDAHTLARAGGGPGASHVCRAIRGAPSASHVCRPGAVWTPRLDHTDENVVSPFHRSIRTASKARRGGEPGAKGLRSTAPLKPWLPAAGNCADGCRWTYTLLVHAWSGACCCRGASLGGSFPAAHAPLTAGLHTVWRLACTAADATPASETRARQWGGPLGAGGLELAKAADVH